MPTMPTGRMVLLIEHGLAAVGGRRAHEFDRVVLQIGVWQAAGIFRNAAIVGEMRNRFYVASVGRRNVSRSVSRTQLLASRSAGVGDVLQHVGLLIAKMRRKGEAGFPPPLGALFDSAGSTGPGGIPGDVSTVYSAASAIGTTDTKVRPLAFARNST